ncbi:MAG: acetyl-CoA hydrolase/transferase family protein [Bdellovibrionales bacterium]
MSLKEHIKSGDHIFVHGGAATPSVLIDQLLSQAHELKDVTLYHLHTHGDVHYAKPEYASSFRVVNLFVGANIRPYLDYDRIDYLPCFLSEIGSLFRQKKIKLDVAFIHVSAPDIHGYCSLGTSVDVARAAVDSARVIIAQINPQMPRTHGDGIIHISQITHKIEVNQPLYESHSSQLSEAELKIGRYISELVEDGSTLQMGIGAVPDAALVALKNHKDLGIHSEMWSNHALNLIRSGVVTNSRKKVHPGKTVAAFVTGNRDLFDFIDDNPSTIFLEASYVNQPNVIARNPKVVAINSCVEMDLTGQVCADSVGPKIISGVGGQMDFMRAAFLSEGGKPIIAMTSRSVKGHPRIKSHLSLGAGVVTTRSHIHWVVTEYGRKDLAGLSLGQRAKALIELAHPDDREQLSRHVTGT